MKKLSPLIVALGDMGLKKKGAFERAEAIINEINASEHLFLLTMMQIIEELPKEQGDRIAEAIQRLLLTGSEHDASID